MLPCSACLHDRAYHACGHGRFLCKIFCWRCGARSWLRALGHSALAKLSRAGHLEAVCFAASGAEVPTFAAPLTWLGHGAAMRKVVVPAASLVVVENHAHSLAVFYVLWNARHAFTSLRAFASAALGTFLPLPSGGARPANLEVPFLCPVFSSCPASAPACFVFGCGLW